MVKSIGVVIAVAIFVSVESAYSKVASGDQDNAATLPDDGTFLQSTVAVTKMEVEQQEETWFKTMLQTQGEVPNVPPIESPKSPLLSGSGICRAYPGCDEPIPAKYKVPDTTQYVHVNLLEFFDRSSSPQESANLDFVTDHKTLNEFQNYYNGVVDEEFGKFHSDLAAAFEQRQNPVNLNTEDILGFSDSNITSRGWYQTVKDEGVGMLKTMKVYKDSAVASAYSGARSVSNAAHNVAEKAYNGAHIVGEKMANGAHIVGEKLHELAENGVAFFVALLYNLRAVFDACKQFTQCIMDLPSGTTSDFHKMIGTVNGATKAEGGFSQNVLHMLIHKIMGPFMQENMKSIQSEDAQKELVQLQEPPLRPEEGKTMLEQVQEPPPKATSTMDVSNVGDHTMSNLEAWSKERPKTAMACFTKHLIKPAFDAAKGAVNHFVDIIMVPLTKGAHYLMVRGTGILGKLVEQVGKFVGNAFRPDASESAGNANQAQHDGATASGRHELMALAKRSASEFCLDQLSASSELNSKSSGMVAGVFHIASSVVKTFLKSFLGQIAGSLFVPLLQKGISFMSTLLNGALMLLSGFCGLFPEIGAGFCSFVSGIVSEGERMTHNKILVSGVQYLEGHFADIIAQVPKLMKTILHRTFGGTTLLDEDVSVIRVPEAFQALVPHLVNIADLAAGEVHAHLSRCDLVQQQLAQKDEELKKTKEMLQRLSA